MNQRLRFGFLLISLLALPTPAFAHPGHDGFLLYHLAQPNLSPMLMVSGIAIAFLFGAGHALSPGHGKTMVAAYLVGSKGTSKDAVLLGLVTTISHTVGVFAIGLLALLLSQYIVPEQLYSVLGLISGLLVFGVGLWLLDRRLNELSHSHEHYDHHHHEPLSLSSIVSLGIAGGVIPCPSALVLLLSAIALHHAGYGMVLVSAFSVGLALVLVAIGLLVIYANQWLEQFPSRPKVTRYLPVGSAIAVIITGTLLTVYSII
jgi:nickel/cobalt transporter (NicO) family protein